MRLGLGIDAGGTYTDTVLYDFQRQQVLGKGKALTTKDDYAVGIAASLDQIEIHSPEKVDLVGLSTTLATNALVEGKGAKTGILLIGYDPELVKRFLRVSPYWIVSGGHDMRGRERVPLDEEEIRRAVEEMIEEVEVIAVSQMGGAVNPQHEQWVQAFIQEHYDVPVISGHEIDLAHKSLAAQLKERSVERWYLALAKGSFTADEGVIDAPIGRHPVRRKQMTVTENGRPARTWYYVRERFDGYTLVECRLETGRTHQVRVHLAYIRHPLVGDQVYGGRQDHLGMTRQALHAYHLGFRHPRTGEFLSFSAPLPADMAEVLERLRRGAVR